MKRRIGNSSKAVPDAHESGDPPQTRQPLDDDPPPDSNPRKIPAEIAGESNDTLTLYLRDVRRTQLFTPQEEFATATRARAAPSNRTSSHSASPASPSVTRSPDVVTPWPFKRKWPAGRAGHLVINSLSAVARAS